ncbi:MAG: acyltransferase family protein [Bradyrhizobium sp.]
MDKPHEAAPTAERQHALEAVRGFALLLGIVLHATLSFIPGQRYWMILDTHPSITLAVLFFVIHAFRMTTFFLIAGFFAHMSFHRRGALGFAKDRLQRIALPLLVGWPIVFTAMVLVVMWAASLVPGSVSSAPRNWPPVLPRFPLAHLWFLYVLLEFYAATLVLRAAVVWADRSGRLRAGIDRLFALIMRRALAPAIPAIPIGVCFWLDPTWSGWMGVRTPDASLVTNLQAWVGFGTAFSFGWLLHRRRDLLPILQQRWLFNLLAAAGLIAASLVLFGLPPRPIHDAMLQLAGSICYALAIWSTSFAAIGCALRFLAGYSRMRRYLADASYWLYIIHLPLVMALQAAVSRLGWPWPFKFATIMLVGLPVMFASYQFLVRDTFIGLVLNGRRMRREKPPTATTAQPARAPF